MLTPHEVLEVTSESRVEVAPPQLELTPATRLSWEKVREQLERDRSLLAAREFCFDSPLVRSHHLLADYAAPMFTPGRPFVDAVGELSERIFREFKYEPLATDVSTPLAQVLRERRGVCQDFAQLAVGCLRSLGLAGTLRLRLPRDRGARWTPQADRRRRLARLGLRLLARARLDRLRSRPTPSSRASATSPSLGAATSAT